MRIAASLALLTASCGQASQPVANDTEPMVENKPTVTDDATDDLDEAASNATEMPPFAEVPGAHPTAPEPAPIPAKFRGAWAESKAACADIKHPSRLGISGRTMRFPTFVIFGDSVAATDDQFTLKGKIEGTTRPAEAQYFISGDGNVLTDGGGGGAVRVRCG